MNPAKSNNSKSSNSIPVNNKSSHKIKPEIDNGSSSQGQDDLKANLENLKNQNSQTPETSQETGPASKELVDNLYYQIEELKLTLEQTKKEGEEMKLIAQRAVADGQNLARQHELDIESSQKSQKKSVASHILHVINTLFLAFQYQPQTEDPKVLSYFETIRQSFEKSLEDLKVVGIEILTAHKGDSIDFSTMSIINAPESQTEEPKVAQVVSLGLRIDNQVMQPITVMV